jgi:DNA-binding XRE family transcriptional regulator
MALELRRRNRIREFRERLGLSQRAFAQRVGVPEDTLIRLDGNPCAAPRMDTATRIAKALGCEVADLFG